MDEVVDELSGIVSCDEMRSVPVQIIANKQDLPSKILYYYYYILYFILNAIVLCFTAKIIWRNKYLT
jgi:hypothetical protein